LVLAEIGRFDGMQIVKSVLNRRRQPNLRTHSIALLALYWSVIKKPSPIGGEGVLNTLLGVGIGRCGDGVREFGFGAGCP
jgi:hypothetical protein